MITNIKNEEYKNIIRLYVYKLFYFFIQDKDKFLLFKYEIKGIKFLQDFKLKEYPEQINYYYFAPISSLKNYHSKVLKLFNEYPKESYLDKNKRNEFIKNIKDFPPEIFINISINKVISKIGLNNDYKNQANSNLLKFLCEILYNQTFNKKISKLIAFYFDEIAYEKKLSNKLNGEVFLISLYGLRYCLYSLKNENIKKNIYNTLFHKSECALPQDKNQIPGVEKYNVQNFNIKM